MQKVNQSIQVYTRTFSMTDNIKKGDVMDLEPALPKGMDKHAVIFMPINDGDPERANSGTHWSLMVYVREANSFYYYDTLKFNNLREGEKTYKRIQPLLKLNEAAQFIPSSTPQQVNGSDCGGKL